MILRNLYIKTNELSSLINFVKKYNTFKVAPYNWNLLHLVCLFSPCSYLIEECLEQGIPFEIDSNGLTPLHFIFYAEKVDFNVVNILTCYLLQYLRRKAWKRFMNPEIRAVLNALSDIFPRLFYRVNSDLVAEILQFSVSEPESFGHEEITRFGSIRGRKDLAFKQHDSTILTPRLKESLIDESGSHLLNIRVIWLKCNYHPYSSDMMTLLKVLKCVDNEEIFKAEVVKMIIEYLWRHTYNFYGILTIIFSVLMILLSVYLAVDEKKVGLSIAIFSLSAFFLLYEIVQMWVTGIMVYLFDIWNIYDLAYELLLMGTILAIWIDPEDQYSLAMNWLKSLCILFGYIKWLSFFRVFSQTSNYLL